MVLLDVGDGEERAVELEIGAAGGYSAEEGVCTGFQLFGRGAEFSGFAGKLLADVSGEKGFAGVFLWWESICFAVRNPYPLFDCF